MPAPETFVEHVRHALAHLYDPDVLRAHPLLTQLGLGNRANPQAALRDTLLAAIESLKPAPSVPVTSRAWRVYTVLQCRYVQQMDQQQTADQLGIGVRHVRREQHGAVAALADLLYQKYLPPSTALLDESRGRTTLDDELAWLKDGGQDASAPVGDVLGAVLHLAAPLAAARSVTLVEPSLPDLPPAAIHPAALRQALLSAATFAIRRAPGGEVAFAVRSEGDQLILAIHASAGSQPLLAAGGAEAASLQAASAIIGLASGSLDIAERRTALDITITLAAVGVVGVFLIDDNADFAQLFARYVAGTRYRVQRFSGGDLFAALAAAKPRLIVLDVMMPDQDGWELLGRLRQHPLTGSLPVIICTILPERDLALALGATDFLPKPVTRQALLEALARALAGARPRSH